jgi:hypothetical protein
MPDVMHEAARTDFDDAIEIGGDSYECEDVVGVATFPLHPLGMRMQTPPESAL